MIFYEWAVFNEDHHIDKDLKMQKRKSVVPTEKIEKSIFVIRGLKVMLDKDLAELYGVDTKVLKQAVKRNLDRFPSDVMFILKTQEFMNLTKILNP